MTLFLALTLACRLPVDDTATTTADSGTTDVRPPSDLRAAGISLSGAFGYDPDLDAAVPYYFGDTSSPALAPWLELTITLAADNQLPGPCRITLQSELSAIDRAGWVEGPVWFGLDWDWEDVGYDDTCPPLDPTIYPDTLVALARASTFGVGVVPLTDDVLAETQTYIVEREGQIEWDSYWVENVVGGAASWSALDSVWIEGFALGFEVDDDMALVSRAPSAEGPAPPPHDPTLVVPLTRATIEAGDSLPRGVYSVSSRIEFDAQGLLP